MMPANLLFLLNCYRESPLNTTKKRYLTHPLSFSSVTGVTRVSTSNGGGCSRNTRFDLGVTGVTDRPAKWDLLTLALRGRRQWEYPTLAPAKSGAGTLTPETLTAHKRPTLTALFLCLSVMAAVRGQASAWPVSVVSGSEIPRTVAPQEHLTSTWRLQYITEPVIMTKLRLSLAHVRAKAHRKMAFAALHADSSLKNRLSRYQHHIGRARTLEAKEVRS